MRKINIFRCFLTTAGHFLTVIACHPITTFTITGYGNMQKICFWGYHMRAGN